MANMQIRNVPEELHRKLRARAALSGMSLSDYLLKELNMIAEKPTVEEMMVRLASLPAVRLNASVVETLREEREGRSRSLAGMLREEGEEEGASRGSLTGPADGAPEGQRRSSQEGASPDRP